MEERRQLTFCVPLERTNMSMILSCSCILIIGLLEKNGVNIVRERVN